MTSIIKAAQPFFSEKHKKLIMSDFEKILSSKRLIFGQFTERFEQAFAGYHKKKYAVAVHSCSAALEITLRYIGVEGFDVMVPTNTFVATAFSVLKSRGNLILCDIDRDYYGLTLPEIKARVTKKTKAVIVVHIGGYIAPWIPEIRNFCDKRSIFLIEDAAHAHGAKLDGKMAGTFGLAGCFSFYPTKIMTSGVGGCILTDDKKLVGFARSLRHFGEGKGLGDIKHEGDDWIMDEFRAVLAYYQLTDLSENLKKRRCLADWYREDLGRVRGIRTLDPQKTQDPAYYRFLAFLEKGLDKKRILNALRDKYGIEAGSLYDPPIHRQPYFFKKFGFKPEDFPIAEKRLSEQIAFPMHPGMVRRDIEYAARVLMEILQ